MAGTLHSRTMTILRWSTIGLLCFLLTLELFLAFLLWRDTDGADEGLQRPNYRAAEDTGPAAASESWQEQAESISLVPSPIPTPVQLPLADSSISDAARLSFRPSPARPSLEEDQLAPTPPAGLIPTPDSSPPEVAATPEGGLPPSNDPAAADVVLDAQNIVPEGISVISVPIEPPEPVAVDSGPGPTTPISTLHPSPTATPTATPAMTPTATATATPTLTPTPTPSPTPQPTSTATPVPQPTATPAHTPTATPTTAPTATPTPVPAPTATSTPTPMPVPPATGGHLVIECIFYDGEVPRSEADEYVQLLNRGTGPVELTGWRLADLGDRQQEFEFDNPYTLREGQRVRVYTNQVHSQWGGFSFGIGRSIWHNTDPDTAGLFNPSGELVSRKSYPPGC